MNISVARSLSLLTRPRLLAEYVQLARSGLFDTTWYESRYGSQIGDLDPLLHYLQTGQGDGLRPNSWFNPAIYSERVRKGRLGPLMHFLREMRRVGLNPRKRDNVMRFLVSCRELEGPRRHSEQSRPPDRGSDTPPYLLDGAFNGREPSSQRARLASAEDIRLVRSSGLFDLEWYRAKYLDVSDHADPIEHYLTVGAAAGNDPRPDFSAVGYTRRYSDVQLAGLDPFVHYLRFGQMEGRLSQAARQTSNTIIGGELVRIGEPEYGPISHVLRYDAVVGDAGKRPDVSVCVHIHLYYDELIDAFIEALAKFPFPLTLLVSIPAGSNATALQSAVEQSLLPGSRIILEQVPNRGRDIAPWLVTFRDEVRKHDLFCHLHSKRSPHSSAGAHWFDFLMHATSGSTQVITDIVDLFRHQPNLGLVGPPFPGFLAGQPNWGANRVSVETLAARMGIGTPPDECPFFPAGSFFWARPQALEPMFAMKLTYQDFEVEAGNTDGTVAHAVERLLGWIPVQLGWQTCCATVDVAPNLTSYFGEKRLRPKQTRPTIAAPTIVPHRPPVQVVVYTNEPQPRAEARFAAGGSGSNESVEISGLPTDLYGEPTLPPGLAPFRLFKLHPHRYLPACDVAIWINSNVSYLGDFQSLARELLDSGADVGFALHPVRRTFAEEAREIISRELDDPAIVLRQVARYLRIPGVRNAPLFDTSLFLCRPGSPEAQEFMESWWSEVRDFSFRDQLSAGVTALRTRVRWSPILQGRSPLTHPLFVVSDPIPSLF